VANGSLSPLAKKLLIKPGFTVHLIGAPEGYTASLGDLPAGARLVFEGGRFDFVQLFARTKAEVGALAGQALASLQPGGVLWATFPKGSSKVQTDLTRDRGWDAFTAAGWQLVALVSVDDTWSAARLRPIGSERRR
jgi:hypothetical protein